MNWCEYPGYLVGSEVLQNYGCRMASGLWVTFELVAISVAIGFFLALGLAITRLYGPRWARMAVSGYTTFLRGTPLLCQLFLVYYGLGQFREFWQDTGLWWFFREPFYCAAFTFTINTAAYQMDLSASSAGGHARGRRRNRCGLRRPLQ